jgi:hypothetical protein
MLSITIFLFILFSCYFFYLCYYSITAILQCLFGGAMATGTKSVLTAQDRKVIVDALETQRAMYARAARAEKFDAVREIKENAAQYCVNLAAKVASVELEL